MAFHLPAILSILCLAFAATQAALPGEVYWNSLLPNTTMPRAISNVLLPGKGEETVSDPTRRKYINPQFIKIEYILPPIRTGYARPPPPSRTGYARPPPPSRTGYARPPPPSRTGYARPPPPSRTGYARPPPPSRTGYGRPPPPSRTGYARPPPPSRTGYARPPPPSRTGYGRPPPPSRTGYARPPPPSRTGYARPPPPRRTGYARPPPPRRRGYTLNNEENDVPINVPSAPWFLEKDLYPGKIMEMEIGRPENDGYTFVPRQVADSIPFSSDKLTTILDKLSIKPESPKAQMLKDTLKECELPAEEGEVKTCATSLESMIDFSIQQLGNHIQAVSTEAEKDTKLQNFTMLEGINQIEKSEAVACHKMNYAYAVFYCHDVRGARAYTVPFVGTSGTKVKAVGICHTNTTAWSPEHDAFKILKVKPGGEPVCHFLYEYNILWTRK